MFGKKFKDLSLNAFGKSVADYLHSGADIVLASHPVKDIPTTLEINEDKSSYKQTRATTRFIFDCGAIWSLAAFFLRDEEYKDLDMPKAEALAFENINEFLKEGLKYVSKHDYELPKLYNNHNTIINLELDSRLGGEESPFSKGVTFSARFLKEYYGMNFEE